MFFNSNLQHRVKHYDLLLSRELANLQREHSQNLITYEKFENSIRRDSKQNCQMSRRKISTPSEYSCHEQIDAFDYRKVCSNSFKRRLSSSTSSNHSQHQLDDFDDDTVSYSSFKQRRYSTKNQRLPPMVKATSNERGKNRNKNQYWMANFQQTNKSKENPFEPFTIVIEETPVPIRPEPTPLQRQIRSFLNNLPTYRGIQNGFDNFAPSSLYSNRPPIVIR
ncbi:unnamed protein product [Adineta ricciae]|uniref:Uncharacterized protein n=1 Tax=Adineta ricciae TaxID=249248 RepID=A0A815M2C6_ADIRI|nr:unnamed protein product [Adineta ricciae]CAF1410759.1 unnamed protein product [Adineta ricciae]